MRVKHAACQTPAVKKQPTIAPEVVTKLESENADLRDKLQELQAQLEAQGGTQKELDEAVNLAAQEKQAREAAEAELEELRTRLAATVRLERGKHVFGEGSQIATVCRKRWNKRSGD